MASRSDTEILTEHFGYPPVSLLDEIINSINYLAERALNSIEQGLLNAPPASLGFRPPTKHPRHRTNGASSSSKTKTAEQEEAEAEEEEAAAARRHRDEIEAGTHQLETLLWASIDRNFDRLEIYVLRNILCLREAEMGWIRLGHYEGLEFGGSSSAGGAVGGDGDGEIKDGRSAVEGVNHLRRRLQASQRLNCMLVAERARNAALLGEMRRLVGRVPGVGGIKSEAGAGGEEEEQQQRPPFRFLHEKGDLTEGDAETPLTTTAAFSLVQLQALRELSTTLRKGMPRLAAAGGEEAEEEEEGGKKTWRRERLEYVETATRKHLENVRGLELGKNGEVRDGEWDGGGRHLAKGEVESLERVVGMLGGGQQDQDRMDES